MKQAWRQHSKTLALIIPVISIANGMKAHYSMNGKCVKFMSFEGYENYFSET